MFFALRKLGEWESYEKKVVAFQKTEENMEKQTHISVLSLFVFHLISLFLYEQCAFNSFHIATSAFSFPGTISAMCTAWNLRPGTNSPGTSISATLCCARHEFAPDGDKLAPGTGLNVAHALRLNSGDPVLAFEAPDLLAAVHGRAVGVVRGPGCPRGPGTFWAGPGRRRSPF